MAQLVFVDLETTGLDVERHGIIEIACIFEMDGKRGVEGWHSLVNPGNVEHTESAAAVHKIPREAIDTAPPLLDVLRQFDSRCADGAIVRGGIPSSTRLSCTERTSNAGYPGGLITTSLMYGASTSASSSSGHSRPICISG
jgi:hypothetical protein